VSIKLPIRSGQHWAKAVLLATSAVVFFWAFYRTGVARNFFDSKQFSWVASIASILGVGVLPKVSGRKRQFTMATVVLFTLAALVGKASETQDFPFKLLTEPRGPKSTRATSPNLGRNCGPYDNGTISVLYSQGIYAFANFDEFKSLYAANVCNIRSILGSLGVSSTEHAVYGQFDACDPFSNRIVLDTAAFSKIDNEDGEYGGTPLFGNFYSASFGNVPCHRDLRVVMFPESGVMVDKLGLNPSFIPR
jgi:hypothetical protein